MKRFFLVISAVFTSVMALFAQEAGKEVKTGWTLSALPCLSYSSLKGVELGVFGDVYYYGDGSSYPEYHHDIGFELSHFTEGRTLALVYYDSKHFIPGIRINASATYLLDPYYNFFGFNGAAQPFITSGAEGFNYYGMNRDMLRIFTDFQGEISPHLNWAAGLAFWDFKLGKQKNNSGKTLYQDYIASGILGEKEEKGGTRLEFKAGAVFDTRDREAAPNSGIWAELFLVGSPSISADGFNYLKLNAHFRHYIQTPIQWRGGGINLAYHLAYTGTVAGNAPFYIQQNIPTLYLRQVITEGLGSCNTIRGFYENRMVADGYFWANTEVRIKVFSFTFLRQFFYAAVNPFFDFGAIVQPYRAAEMGRMYGLSTEDIVGRARTFEHSAGIGFKLAWNENFILSAEIAKSLKSPDYGMGPDSWLNLGMGYAF